VVTEIADGVFFTRPGLLPRGRHDLPPEQVLAAQRQKILIAVTELMAAGGHREFGIREITAQARVSLSAFYQCFADKEECVFAAYDRFIAVVTEQVITAIEGPQDWASTVSAVVGAYLTTLDSDPVVARAFQVEMDAWGRPARERRRAALTAMAELLKQRRDEVWPGAEDVPLSAYLGAIYAVRQMASDRVDAGDQSASSLNAEVQPWIALMLEHTRTQAVAE
jgi:AcrR family transcriptional regulator